MEALPYSFGIFTICGIWRPISWSSGFRRFLYDFYTLFVMALMYSFGFMEFVDALYNFGRIEELVSASFMLLTVGNTCCKAVNVINRRTEIIDIFEMLNASVCLVKSMEEEEIMAKYKIRIRNNVAFYFCVVEGAVLTMTVSSIIQNIPEHSLPFKVWIPFNYSSNRVYWCLYYHQIVSDSIEATIAIAYDTMVPGVMLLTCQQLGLIKFRFERMMKYIRGCEKNCLKIQAERRFLSQAIYHHRIIAKFAKSFNDVFSSIIFVQYAVSCFVIGLSVYRLAELEIRNPEFPFAVFYLACMTSQIFYYCWYGNEVIFESSGITEAIYKMDWSLLDFNTKKDLLMIMRGTMQPIIFTSGKILILSVESFMGIMKISYTAFNVLQRR